jgi:hypothetical protein
LITGWIFTVLQAGLAVEVVVDVVRRLHIIPSELTE